MVNAVSLSRLARAAMMAFMAHDKRILINISSATAIHPHPGTALYSASEAPVLSLSLGLQHEVNGTGVTVQAVLPAATATEVWDGIGIDLKGLFPETVMSAEAIVDAALTGLDSGKAVTFPPVADAAAWKNFSVSSHDLFAAQTGTPALRYREARPTLAVERAWSLRGPIRARTRTAQGNLARRGRPVTSARCRAASGSRLRTIS